MVRGKNVVVTGCLSGIGRETLEAFAQAGADVFACAFQKEEGFEQFCRELERKNQVHIYPVYFDMADPAQVKEAVQEIQSKKLDIHGLVNIAGINKDAFFGMITYSDMTDTFQVNVFSQIIFSQYIIRLMQRRKTPGSVVFTSSITALDGNAGQTVYGASKAALIGAVKTMALELGEKGIRVNAVAPGVIETPMTAKLKTEVKEKKRRATELNRLGSAREVADVFLFLVSDLSSHISGQVIRADGGIG